MLGGNAAMSLLESVRTRFNGQTTEAFGEGQRHPVTKSMIKSIKMHITSLRDTDITSYSFERRRSDYKDAQSDLVIYDGEGHMAMHGRDFGHVTSFWQ